MNGRDDCLPIVDNVLGMVGIGIGPSGNPVALEYSPDGDIRAMPWDAEEDEKSAGDAGNGGDPSRAPAQGQLA